MGSIFPYLVMKNKDYGPSYSHCQNQFMAHVQVSGIQQVSSWLYYPKYGYSPVFYSRACLSLPIYNNTEINLHAKCRANGPIL